MRYDTSIVEASSARAENLNASFGSSSSWEDAASAKSNAASAMPEIAFIAGPVVSASRRARRSRSEEHTSELQSHHDLVCRLLLEKKKNTKNATHKTIKKNEKN